MKMIQFLRVILLVCLLTSLSACGGSSGGDGVSVSADIPNQRSTYAPGSSIPFELTLTNFTLAPPFDRRNAILRDHPADEMDSEASHSDSSHNDAHSHNESHSHGDSHLHDADAVNPDAREGHYHVYLNAAEGSDPHLTAWTMANSYAIPEDIEEGTHTLRIELRDNNHMRVGVETIVFFDVTIP